MNFKLLPNNVTAPLGFEASGINAGIKKQKEDLGLIFSKSVCSAAAVFTTNKLKAAPVLFDIDQLSRSNGKARAILVNSGIANAATGSRGLRDVQRVGAAFSSLFGMNKNQILVCSTGKIGLYLPVDIVLRGIKKLKKSLSREDTGISKAIMTTDTKEKECAIEVELNNKKFRIGGIAKGAGMVNPSLATLLCFITTDVRISSDLLDLALKNAVKKSFNSICIDNDTSTNDSIIVLASGKSGVSINKENFRVFSEALQFICLKLAKDIVRDGEGATKFVEIRVRNAAREEDAYSIAKTIALSYLVKTAIFGNDPNWGRVLASIGYAPVKGKYDYGKIDIYLDKAKVVENSCLTSRRVSLKKDELLLVIDMKNGKQEAGVYTCDLSYSYVEINSEYTT
ncbi:bifunctional glutamate N-acetyltransferase/amino-acid acetyltransferase ArgJ [Candidatus Micrarchaeota archaeon]|nr:bifunctional glutamate N-acetyltransferase/amino-acid acetyltransferase ArgJ [Candidatus Micrarchaeota archaeon]